MRRQRLRVRLLRSPQADSSHKQLTIRLVEALTNDFALLSLQSKMPDDTRQQLDQRFKDVFAVSAILVG